MKRYAVIVLTAAVCAAAIVGGHVAVTSAQVPASKHYRSAPSTVQAYFQVLNTGMASGDFSGLPSVFAKDAVLTKSGTDGTTALYRGVAEITAFYKALYQKIPGWQWTTDVERSLSKTIIIAYEHAGSPPLTVASRCVHVFVIKKGMITSYDWAAFYPGQK